MRRAASQLLLTSLALDLLAGRSNQSRATPPTAVWLQAIAPSHHGMPNFAAAYTKQPASISHAVTSNNAAEIASAGSRRAPELCFNQPESCLRCAGERTDESVQGRPGHGAFARRLHVGLAHDPAEQQAGECGNADYRQRMRAHLKAHGFRPLVLPCGQVFQPGSDDIAGVSCGRANFFDCRIEFRRDTIHGLVGLSGELLDRVLQAIGTLRDCWCHPEPPLE
jgi:hypothetical protein